MSTQLLLWLKKTAPDIHQWSLFGQKSGAIRILAHMSHVLLSFDLHLYYLHYHNISQHYTLKYPILSNMNQDRRGEGTIPAQGLPIVILAPKATINRSMTEAPPRCPTIELIDRETSLHASHSSGRHWQCFQALGAGTVSKLLQCASC